MGRTKRLPPQGDVPFSIAAKPDRSLSLLGTYVMFTRSMRHDGKVIARKGDLGIVVRDVKGRCKQDQVAVRIHGDERDYRAVPRKTVKFPGPPKAPK